ncbi:MAG: hypothetical protein ACXVKL_14320 [Candidatus Angelobacter sp.]
MVHVHVANPVVPTMFLFDKSGKTASVMYGAPPDLHQHPFIFSFLY